MRLWWINYVSNVRWVREGVYIFVVRVMEEMSECKEEMREWWKR